MGFNEDYEAFLKTKPLSDDYSEFVAKKERDADLAAGGSIKQTPVERLPIGATIGGTAGAVGGGFLTGGNPLGIAGGGLAGTIAGEGIQQGVEHLLDARTKPKSIKESLGRIGEEAFYSLAGEGIGAGFGHGLGLLLRKPLSMTVSPESQRAMDFLQRRAPGVQPPLMPHEATEGRGLDTLGNIAQSSFFGGGTMTKYMKNREQVMDLLSESLVEEIGPKLSPDEFGQLFMQAVEGNKHIARAPAKVMYNDIDDALQPVERIVMKPVTSKPHPDAKPITTMVQTTEMVDPLKFSIKSLKKEMAPLAEQAKKLKRLEGEAVGDDVAVAIDSMPTELNYADIQSLRSRLMAKKEQLEMERKGAPAIRIMGKAIGQLTREMDRALEAYDPALNAVRKEADKIWSASSKDFSNKFVRSLFRKGMEQYGGEPAAIAKALLRPGEVNRVKLMRTAIGEENWPKMQSVAMQDILKIAEDSEGVIQGHRLNKALDGRSGYGKDKLDVLFTPTQQSDLREFANAVHQQQTRPKGVGGGFLIQVAQAGAVMDLMGAFGDEHYKGSSIFVLLAPELLAKAMTHGPTAKAIIRGMSLPKGSRVAGQVAGQLMSILYPRATVQRDAQPATPSRPGTMSNPMLQNQQ
jgi:hypothetical protein